MEACFVFCYHKQRLQCITPQFMDFGWISNHRKDEYSPLFLSLKKFTYVYFVVSDTISFSLLRGNIPAYLILVFIHYLFLFHFRASNSKSKTYEILESSHMKPP